MIERAPRSVRRKQQKATRPAGDPAGKDRFALSANPSKIAAGAVCMYWVLFGVPFPWDLSLFLLAGAALWIAIHTAGARSSHRYWNPILLFVAAILFSIPAAPDIARSVQFSLALVPSVLIFYLISEKIEARDLLWLSQGLGVVALLLGLWLLWVRGLAIGEGPVEWVKAAHLTLFHVPNDVVMLVILAPFSLASLVRKPRSPTGISGMLCLLVSAAVAVIYESRLSVLLLVCVLGIAGVFMLERKKFLLAALFLPAFLCTVDALNGAALAAKFSSAWDSRLPLWFASWCMFLKHPVTGNGPGSFLFGYPECLAGLVEGGFQPLSDSRIAPWVHSLYLEVLAEHGLVGFFSLIILLAYGIVNTYCIRFPLGNAIHPLKSSVLAALTVFCVAAVFELSLWRQWVSVMLFTLMGIAAGIYRVYRAQRGAQ